MFSFVEVDELFASTTRVLQRSQVLLEERRSTSLGPTALPPIFCQPVSSAASTAVGVGAFSSHSSSSTTIGSTSSSSSNSFIEIVRSLQSLSAFRGFVEATTVMQAKVEGELTAPSPNLQQRRRKGFDFALLQSVTRGLRSATTSAAASWRTADATAALWTGGTTAYGNSDDGEGEEGGDANDPVKGAGSAFHHTSSATTSVNATTATSGGAQVAAALLFGAFCVDVALSTPRAAPATAAYLQRIFALSPPVKSPSERKACGGETEKGADTDNDDAAALAEWSRERSERLCALLGEVTSLLPKSVSGRFVGRVARLLFDPRSKVSFARSEAAHMGCFTLSGGQFLFPAFDTYLLERYPSTLASRWFLKPLQDAAQNLRADYYRSAAVFAAQCRWLLCLVFVLVRACQTSVAAALSSENVLASLSLSQTPRTPADRHVRIVKQIYDAWLMPLEKTFGHDAARHGMSTFFYTHLVLPHAQLMSHLQVNTAGMDRDIRNSSGCGVSSTRAWSSILHTAQYRLLMVLEKLAQSEVAQAHGTSTTASKQRTYEALLRQNGGKISVSLLQILAEDKQLVLEETPSRSPEGHRLYRLHDGVADSGGISSGGARAVFVYVDDGALFTKVGRSRVFQRVKSVEEMFRPLQ